MWPLQRDTRWFTPSHSFPHSPAVAEFWGICWDSFNPAENHLFSTLLHKMAPWCLEEMMGRTRLIKYQLTKLLVPTLALLPKVSVCVCPVSSIRLKMSTAYPDRQWLPVRLGKQRRVSGGTASPSELLHPRSLGPHTHPSPTSVLQILTRCCSYKENCKYLMFTPTADVSFTDCMEFWGAVLLTSKRMSSPHPNRCLFISESLLLAK